MTDDGGASALVATGVLARGSPEWVGPGLTGFLVIIGLLIAIIVLYRSMNKQLKKIRFRDDEDRPDDEGPDDEGPDDEGPDDEGPDDEGPDDEDRPDSDPPRASG